MQCSCFRAERCSELTFFLVLQIVHDCDWVHRDISIANIYEYKGRGLLGDLEYAKRGGDDTDHLFRTVNSFSVASYFYLIVRSFLGYALLHGR